MNQHYIRIKFIRENAYIYVEIATYDRQRYDIKCVFLYIFVYNIHLVFCSVIEIERCCDAFNNTPPPRLKSCPFFLKKGLDP